MTVTSTAARYSKAIGAVLGAIVGLLVELGIDMAWATPEFVAGLSTIIGAGVGSYWSPPNDPVS